MHVHDRFRRMILDTISETKKYVSLSNRMYHLLGLIILKTMRERNREREREGHSRFYTVKLLNHMLIYRGICLSSLSNISTFLDQFFSLVKISFPPIRPHKYEYINDSIILDNPFPHAMVLILISSILIVGFIIGLAVTRYYTYYRRKYQSKDSSYSVSRYWRGQYASTSFDSLVTSSPSSKTNPANVDEINETTRIIKSSFSWPEATILQQQQQQQAEKTDCSSTISSTSLSHSSTMEQILESASLTFTLRYDANLSSLFVRIINARDLFVQRHHRRSSLIDSYIRVELLCTENQSSQGIFFVFNQVFHSPVPFFFLSFLQSRYKQCALILLKKMLNQSTMNYLNLFRWIYGKNTPYYLLY